MRIQYFSDDGKKSSFNLEEIQRYEEEMKVALDKKAAENAAINKDKDVIQTKIDEVNELVKTFTDKYNRDLRFYTMNGMLKFEEKPEDSYNALEALNGFAHGIFNRPLF